MTDIILTLLIDGTMAVLLLVTIAYCGKLNKRIKILQDSKSELSQVVQEFDKAADRATASIAEIHKATSRLSENLQHKLDKANYLADDLQFMIEKGSKMAGRMDASPARSEAAPAASSRRSKRGSESSGVEAIAKGRAKRDDDEVLETIEPKRGGREAKKREALESVLKKATGQEGEEEAPAGRGKRSRQPMARMRSKAEQELFDAMKTGNS